MKKTALSYTSADGVTQIHGCLWEPEGVARGVIQIAHGVTEHMGRYEAFAAYFTGRGYVVAGNDHLGHGLSLHGSNPLPMYFGGEGSWQYVVEDVKALALVLKGRYPGLPCCLLGFSLGSFVVRTLLGQEPQLADATIWAGTGQASPIERFLAKVIVSLEQRRFGETKNTPLLQKLTMDTYNQRFQPCRTGADWICANPEAVDTYLADPLCGEGFTVSSFRELLRGMELSASEAHVAKMNPSLPVLLLSGTDDPVGSFGKGVALVRRQLENHGFGDVTAELFPGMRHDIFRDADSEKVLSCIEAWLGERGK